MSQKFVVEVPGNRLFCEVQKIIRGGIKSKNRENLGGNPEMSQFQFGNFENMGGVSIFQKCPNDI